MSLPPINYNDANSNRNPDHQDTWKSANPNHTGNIPDGTPHSYENRSAQETQNTQNTIHTSSMPNGSTNQTQNNTSSHQQYGQYGEANPQVRNFTSGYRTVIPMRPLGIGDTLDSAIRLLKFNPFALIIFPLLVAVIFTIIGFVVNLATGQTAFVNPSSFFNTEIQDSNFFDSELLTLSYSTLGILGISTLITVILFSTENTIISISATRTVIASVRGYKLSLQDTWNIVKPRFLSLFFKLIGLTIALIAIGFVLMLIGVAAIAGFIAIIDNSGISVAFKIFFTFLLFLAFIFLVFTVYIRLLISVPALIAENCGVLTSIKRSLQLTRGSFWHIAALLFFTFIFIFAILFVIEFSTLLLYATIGNTVNIEALTGGFILISLLSSLLGQVFIYPVITTLINLLYVNMRFKRENFHQQLLFEAGSLQTQNPAQNKQY